MAMLVARSRSSRKLGSGMTITMRIRTSPPARAISPLKSLKGAGWPDPSCGTAWAKAEVRIDRLVDVGAAAGADAVAGARCSTVPIMAGEGGGDGGSCMVDGNPSVPPRPFTIHYLPSTLSHPPPLLPVDLREEGSDGGEEFFRDRLVFFDGVVQSPCQRPVL